MRMLFMVSAAILFVAVAAAQSQPQLNILPLGNKCSNVCAYWRS